MTEQPENGSKMNRREFIIRAAKAAATVAASGYIAYRFREEGGPSIVEAKPRFSFRAFAVPGTESRMSIVSGANRRRTLNAALDAIGGIETYIKPGDRVLLKVNAAFALPPILAATSHPDLVSELVKLCAAAGATRVVVTDHPINDARACFNLTGIARAAEEAGAQVVIPRQDDFLPFSLEGGRLINNWPVLARPFEDITKVIGVAPVKDHHRSGASMTLKNWYGLLGGRRNVFHQEIHEIIRELALMIKPTLVILDGTESMTRNGPTGGSLSDLKPTHTMIASTDPVAADAFGATLLGRRLSDLPYITKAAISGAGTANFELLSPKRINMNG